MMKKPKTIMSIVAIAIAALMSISAFAATETGTSADNAQPAATNSTSDSTQQAAENRNGKHSRFALTDEQKAEMEAKKAEMDAISEKWSALTDVQKEEIYSLKEKASGIDNQIIDKYLEWGLIDEETAAEMKAGLTERMTQMRENGRMPLLRGKGGFGKGRHGKFGCKVIPSTDDTAADTQTNGI
jgi:hypothetical protein